MNIREYIKNMDAKKKIVLEQFAKDEGKTLYEYLSELEIQQREILHRLINENN